MDAGSAAAKRESFASYERAQERAVAYTVLARRRTLAGYAAHPDSPLLAD